MSVERIRPGTLKERIDGASRAPLVVCAYDSQEKCNEHSLGVQRETSLPALENAAPEKGTPLVFYCA